MPYTLITELTIPEAKRLNGEIDDGAGYIKPGHTFFYLEDLQKVIDQNLDAPVKNLRLVNVKFERNDGGKNHGRHEITVLALRKTDDEIADLGGDFDSSVEGKSKYHPILGIPWPVYYKRNSTESLIDEDNEGFIGEQFQGDDAYVPGNVIHKV